MWKFIFQMAVEWEQIEESWKNERIKLDAQIEESGAFLAQIDDIEKWLKDARIQLKTGYNTNSLMQQALVSLTIRVYKLSHKLCKNTTAQTVETLGIAGWPHSHT